MVQLFQVSQKICDAEPVPSRIVFICKAYGLKLLIPLRNWIRIWQCFLPLSRCKVILLILCWWLLIAFLCRGVKQVPTETKNTFRLAYVRHSVTNKSMDIQGPRNIGLTFNNIQVQTASDISNLLATEIRFKNIRVPWKHLTLWSFSEIVNIWICGNGDETVISLA